MEPAEMFAAGAVVRRTTADWLDTLDEPALDTPSLCGEWRVRDVAAHLLAPLVTSVPTMLLTAVRVGFRPHRANVVLARDIAARPIGEITAGLREHADLLLEVPFVGRFGPFTDLLVHTADMRVPLDTPWRPEPAWAAESLRFVAGGKAVGFADRKRLAGLRVVATDADVVLGEGEEVRGASYDLVLALCGRTVGLTSLEGPGTDVLASRLGR